MKRSRSLFILGCVVGVFATPARAAGPPKLIAAFTYDDSRILVTFEAPVRLSSATNINNYSLASFSLVTNAQLIFPHQVMLTAANKLLPGATETVTVNGVVDDSSGIELITPSSRSFIYGVLAPSDLQAPDPDSLAGPSCVDRSRFAGPDTLPGLPVTVLATCVGNYNIFNEAVLSDTAGSAPRAGILAICPYARLYPQTVYRVVGRVCELNGNTTLAMLLYADSLYVAPEPLSRFQLSNVSSAVLAKAGCDPNQNILNGEDYEGVLVSLPGVQVWRSDPFKNFFAAGPQGQPQDTVGVKMLNLANRFPYDEGTIMNLGGMVYDEGGRFVVAPRDRSDLQLLFPEHIVNGLPVWVFGPGQAVVTGAAPTQTLTITGMAGDGRDGVSVALPNGSQGWSSGISLQPSSPSNPTEGIDLDANYKQIGGDPDFHMLTSEREAEEKLRLIAEAKQKAQRQQEEDNKAVQEKVNTSEQSRAEQHARNQVSGAGGVKGGVGVDVDSLFLAGGFVEHDTTSTERDTIAYLRVEAPLGQSPAFDFISAHAVDGNPALELRWPSALAVTKVRNVDSLTVVADRLVHENLRGLPKVVSFTDIGLFPRNATSIQLTEMAGGANLVDVTDVRPVLGSLRVLSNPARGPAQLEMSLASPGPLELALYDVAGRRIMEWSWPAATAGTRKVSWDGNTRTGLPVRAGLVLAKMRAAGRTWTAKIVRL